MRLITIFVFLLFLQACATGEFSTTQPFSKETKKALVVLSVDYTRSPLPRLVWRQYDPITGKTKDKGVGVKHRRSTDLIPFVNDLAAKNARKNYYVFAVDPGDYFHSFSQALTGSKVTYYYPHTISIPIITYSSSVGAVNAFTVKQGKAYFIGDFSYIPVSGLGNSLIYKGADLQAANDYLHKNYPNVGPSLINVEERKVTVKCLKYFSYKKQRLCESGATTVITAQVICNEIAAELKAAKKKVFNKRKEIDFSEFRIVMNSVDKLLDAKCDMATYGVVNVIYKGNILYSYELLDDSGKPLFTINNEINKF